MRLSCCLLSSFVALVAAICFTDVASATVLPPNSSVGLGTAGSPGSLSVFSDSPPTLLASSTLPIAPISGAYTGTLAQAVYRTAGGTLDFYYQFSNNANSSDTVERMTMNSFAGFTTDVGYRTTALAPLVAGAQVPQYATRDADGSTVGFDFFNPVSGNRTQEIGPGQTSDILVIRTNATTFGSGFVSVIDGGATTVIGFAPTPEPTAAAVFAVGLAGFGLRRKR